MNAKFLEQIKAEFEKLADIRFGKNSDEQQDEVDTNKRLIKKQKQMLRLIRGRIKVHRNFLEAYVKRLEREQYKLGKRFVCSVDLIKKLIDRSFDEILLEKTIKQLDDIVMDI